MTSCMVTQFLASTRTGSCQVGYLKNITWTVEGRERYPINVRYPRELRQDIDALKRVLVMTPQGEHIPLAQLSTIAKTTGPPSIRDENGSLASIVFVDVAGVDLGTYVQKAKALHLPVRLPKILACQR